MLHHGIDLTPVARIAQMLSRHADRFEERCFTPGERAYCRSTTNIGSDAAGTDTAATDSGSGSGSHLDSDLGSGSPIARRAAIHFAARFAAKEAVMKALGTGWAAGVAWTDIEIINEPSGRPTLRLSGKAAEFAADLGVTRWAVSLSHTDDHAIASVIGWA